MGIKVDVKLEKVNNLSGVIEVPADKSITHRAIMLSSLASGESIVRNNLPSGYCNRTIEVFRQMGTQIKIEKGTLHIKGGGLDFPPPKDDKYEFYAGNSGTTARLLSGILAGQNFESFITGDQSLSKRPMGRGLCTLCYKWAQILL